MEIRYISELDDKLRVSEIYERSWKYAYKNIIPQQFLDSIEKDRWIPMLELSDWYILLCIEDGKYVGASSFCQSRFSEYPNYGEIVTMYLCPEHIGKGYETKLFETVILELNNKGYDELFLWVLLDENDLAKKFYKKHHFIETDNCIDVNIGGKILREVMYVYKG